MKLFAATLLLITFFTCSCSSAVELPLVHLVRQPLVASDQPPMLILLHGYGSNEEDLFTLASSLPEELLIISVRAPISIGDGQFAWYNLRFENGKPVYNSSETDISRQQIISFIEDMKHKHHPDPSRIFLCGFSQGAIMSYSVALNRPDLVKGVAAMSGRLLQEDMDKKYTDEKVKDLKVLISHGTEDKKIPVSEGDKANTFLQSLGVQPEYKTYKAVHEINAAMLGDLKRWMTENI